jgi:hypothetical protein
MDSTVAATDDHELNLSCLPKFIKIRQPPPISTRGRLAMNEDLTLCSVSFHSGLHLAANYALTAEASGPLHWLVAQNGPSEDLPQFQVVPGAAPPTAIAAGNPGIKIASYHHALGLNAVLGHLRTRFVLFLDPDFFIVPPLGQVVQMMRERGLVMFGAPYAIDPKKTRRQDFPCAFCLFVDTEQVRLADLDFLPDVTRLDVLADTGYHIYTRFAGAPHDIALPSYSGPTPFRHTRRQLSDVCPHAFMKASTDAYFWNEQLFGIHLHMKLHIHLQTVGKYATKLAAKADLQTVRQIVTHARSQSAAQQGPAGWHGQAKSAGAGDSDWHSSLAQMARPQHAPLAAPAPDSTLAMDLPQGRAK